MAGAASIIPVKSYTTAVMKSREKTGRIPDTEVRDYATKSEEREMGQVLKQNNIMFLS